MTALSLWLHLISSLWLKNRTNDDIITYLTMTRWVLLLSIIDGYVETILGLDPSCHPQNIRRWILWWRQQIMPKIQKTVCCQGAWWWWRILIGGRSKVISYQMNIFEHQGTHIKGTVHLHFKFSVLLHLFSQIS